MSLAIDTNRVTAVLLADGWHQVAKLRDWESSFDIDSYEFVQTPEPYDAQQDYERVGPDEFRRRHTRLVVGGGRAEGVTSYGFTFTTNSGDVISGPLTAVLAVRHAA